MRRRGWLIWGAILLWLAGMAPANALGLPAPCCRVMQTALAAQPALRPCCAPHAAVGLLPKCCLPDPSVTVLSSFRRFARLVPDMACAQPVALLPGLTADARETILPLAILLLHSPSSGCHRPRAPPVFS